MPIAGKDVSLKLSGPSTSTGGDFTSDLGNGLDFRVDDPARRRWDPAVTVVINADGNVVDPAQYVFDYGTGIVHFIAPPDQPVTIQSGNFFTMLALPEVMSFTAKLAAELADKTSFDSAGWHQFQQLLKTGEGDFEMFGSPLQDLDAVTGGVQSLFAFLTNTALNATPRLLEIKRGTKSLCVFVKLQTLEDKGEMSALLTTSVAWVISATGAGATASFEP